MKQAIRLYGHERERDTAGRGEFRGDLYRCSECSVRFEMEQTVVGPRCCPACGAIYTATAEILAEQLARCAQALNTDPTTLLWTMRIIVAGLQSVPR